MSITSKEACLVTALNIIVFSYALTWTVKMCHIKTLFIDKMSGNVNKNVL